MQKLQCDSCKYQRKNYIATHAANSFWEALEKDVRLTTFKLQGKYKIQVDQIETTGIKVESRCCNLQL